jgi:hypothetical protein
MSFASDPDKTISAWLEDGPRTLPATTRRAIHVTSLNTRQTRRPWWAPWRDLPMNGTARLVAVGSLAALVAAIGVVALSPGSSPPTTVAVPSASPSGSPTTIDTSSWDSYTSTRYGFTINHPTDATVQPATRDWTMATDRTDWQSTAAERFVAAPNLLVTAWSIPIPIGTSLNAWITQYCGGCPVELGAAQPVDVDGHPGKLLKSADDVQAFVAAGERIYVVAAWRGWATPNLLAYLSTMKIVETGTGLLGPPVDTSAWTTMTSNRYGLSFGHPPGWTETPASRTWDPTSDTTLDIMSSAMESAYSEADGGVRLSAWAMPPPAGTAIEARDALKQWAVEFCTRTGNSSCDAIPQRAIPMCLEQRDCHPAIIVTYLNDVQAYFIGGGAANGNLSVVAVWRAEGDPSTQAYGGTIHLLQGVLQTMNVWPPKYPESP